MLSIAEPSAALNCASLCLADRPSVRARENEAIMPVQKMYFFQKLPLTTSMKSLFRQTLFRKFPRRLKKWLQCLDPKIVCRIFPFLSFFLKKIIYFYFNKANSSIINYIYL